MREKTAVIYCRVSTTRQAEDELSLESQRQRCEERAAQLGAVVLKVFQDEGISGRSDDRPAFQAAMLFCEAYTPSYFVLWSTSRFARNRLDAQLYKRRLAKIGTELVYVSVTIDRTSDGGWLTEGVMELFDEWHSRQIAADTRRSMMRSAQQGYWPGGSPPFGFRAVPAPEQPRRRRLEPEEAEALIVQRIFQMRAQGHGARAISILLNADGVLNRDRRWHKSSVLALLRNHAVRGQIVFGRRIHVDNVRRFMPPSDWIVVDAHPPIIDAGLWEIVQGMMDRDALNTNPTEPTAVTGSPHSTHLFTGLLRCGRCGAALQVETAKGRSRRYSYYNCRSAQQDGSCPTRRIPSRELDEWLLNVLCADLMTPQTVEAVLSDLRELAGRLQVERRKRRLAVEEDIKSLARRNGKLYEILEEMGRNAPNLGDLAARLRENNAAIKRLEAELIQLEAEPPNVEIDDVDATALAATWIEVIQSDIHFSKARALFSSFIRTITVYDDRIVVDYEPGRLLQQAVPSTLNMLPGTGSNRRPGD